MKDSAGYDLFISHSRRLDARIAESLQRGIESFAKPWWRPRSLRVFRDVSSLSANPNLWSSIETALARTRFLVLLASPEAAASPWVRRELQWWLEHRAPDSLFIAVTAGHVPWSEDTTPVGQPTTSCMPEFILTHYASAPRWVDLRALRSEQQISRHNPALLDAIADIGAAVRGIDKDQLVGEHIRQHRRVLRVATAAVVLLTLLTVATVIASVLFAGQRNTARRQRDIARQQRDLAVSRQLIDDSESLATSNAPVAKLESLAAWRIHPTNEARYAMLLAASRPQFASLTGHTGAVVSIAFSPGGGTLASSSLDGTVRLWSTTTHLPIGGPLAVGGANDAIWSVAFSPDDRLLASGSGDGTVQLWDVATHRPLGAPLTGQSGSASSVAFSPDGRTLVSTGTNGTVQLWDVATRRPLGDPLLAGGKNDAVETVAFSHNGRMLASGSFDGKVRLWNVASHRQIGHPLAKHTAPVSSLASARMAAHWPAAATTSRCACGMSPRIRLSEIR